MADRRITEYLRQNMANYPMEALKKACLNNGFPAAEVEEAASEVLSGATALPASPPPAPSKKKDLKKKLMIVLGIIGGLFAILLICGYLVVSKIRKAIPELASSGSITVRTGTLPADFDPDAGIRTASKMLAALGDEGTNAKFQTAMRQAQEDPMSVIRDMQKYQNMAYPPRETLLLLDSRTSSLLVSEWPNLSGPIRKSLVESLPTVPQEDRAYTVADTIESSRGVNEMLGQSMDMLNQVMQNMPQEQPSPPPEGR